MRMTGVPAAEKHHPHGEACSTPLTPGAGLTLLLKACSLPELKLLHQRRSRAQPLVQVAHPVQQRLLERAVTTGFSRYGIRSFSVQCGNLWVAGARLGEAEGHSPRGPSRVLAQDPARRGAAPPHTRHLAVGRPPLALDVGCACGEDVDGGGASACGRSTKTMTGFLGECLVMAWYGLGHGQQAASLRVADVEALRPGRERLGAREAGRWGRAGAEERGPHLDVQLQGHGAHVRVEVVKVEVALQPSQWATSFARWSEELRARDADGPLDLGGEM